MGGRVETCPARLHFSGIYCAGFDFLPGRKYMVYQIEYFYKTGDSVRSENLTERLEAKWTNLDVAKDNLRRIREHYQYYTSNHVHCYYRKIDLKKSNLEASAKDWFVKEYDFCLILKTDEGRPLQISAPWCGYFESLFNAKIVLETIPIDSDMEISFLKHDI
jgi:hypothetical protein